jgi:hypothetical protein
MTVPVIAAIREKFAETKAEQSAERNEARAAYETLVADSFAGKELDPDKVLELIAAAGFTFDDFEKHVRFEEEHAALEELAASEAVVNQRVQNFVTEKEQIDKDVVRFNAEIRQRIETNSRSIESNRLEMAEIIRAKNRLAKYLGVGRGFASNGVQELPSISRGR